jgi:hypothetical protein
VKIEAGHATATHHPSGHIFEFSIAPAVLKEARAAGLVPR